MIKFSIFDIEKKIFKKLKHIFLTYLKFFLFVLISIPMSVAIFVIYHL